LPAGGGAAGVHVVDVGVSQRHARGADEDELAGIRLPAAGQLPTM
jgi:hypothetical protein